MSSEPSPYALRPEETLAQGFARILAQMTVHARRLVQPQPGRTAAAIHAARISIKRLRALFWLASPVFRPADLSRVKARLRKAGRLLAEPRDRIVMRSALLRLSRHPSNSHFREALARVAEGEVDSPSLAKETTERMHLAALLLLKTLQEARRSTKTIAGWPAAPERLIKASRAAKKAGRKALHRQRHAHYHQWRKKAKRLLYLLELNQAAPGKSTRRLIERVARLQDMLGHYHDGVLLQRRLRSLDEDELAARTVRHNVQLLKRKRHRLRAKVRKIARHVE